MDLKCLADEVALVLESLVGYIETPHTASEIGNSMLSFGVTLVVKTLACVALLLRRMRRDFAPFSGISQVFSGPYNLFVEVERLTRTNSTRTEVVFLVGSVLPEIHFFSRGKRPLSLVS